MLRRVRGEELISRIREGDRAARDALVIELLPLARRVARRYAGGPEAIDDLEQVASVGLIKAIDRFDPERGKSLFRFALTYVEGEVRHHLRDNLGVPHVTRTMRADASRTARVASRLAGKLGRPPQVNEIAAAMGLEPREIREALAVTTALRPPRSLDAGAHPDLETPVDALGDTDERLELVEDLHRLESVFAALSPDDRYSLFLRVAADLPPAEVARQLGVSSRHGSRLVARALERARTIARGVQRRGSQAREHLPDAAQRQTAS
jgi:RNA polymerase sigma-B factor